MDGRRGEFFLGKFLKAPVCPQLQALCCHYKALVPGLKQGAAMDVHRPHYKALALDDRGMGSRRVFKMDRDATTNHRSIVLDYPSTCVCVL